MTFCDNSENFKKTLKMRKRKKYDLTKCGHFCDSFHAVAKSTAEPENSNDLQLANSSTPFNRAFFVRSTRTPKERLARLSMVACNGKGSPFAVFQLSQFLSPLHVTAQTLRSLAVALQVLQLELLAMIYLFQGVHRQDLGNTRLNIHTFPRYRLRIEADSLEQAEKIARPNFCLLINYGQISTTNTGGHYAIH